MGKILITGGAGFIGSHLLEAVHDRGHEVVVYDDLSAGSRDNIAGTPHRFVMGDILDRDRLENAMKGCDGVFHLAALTSVTESMEKPDRYISVNALGTLRVLEAARAAGVGKVVYASSAAVYGDSPELPKREDMRPDPKSPYAVTKLDGEYYCVLFRDAMCLPTACARFFNVFGERQDPASPYAAAVPIFVTRALKNEAINVYGDGLQTRDFVYVKDVAGALAYLMDRGSGVYNVGYGAVTTVNDLVGMIREKTASASPVNHLPERPGEIRHSCAAVDSLRDLGYVPEGSLGEGLARTIEWYGVGKQS
ncbi:MAG: NAD-dependent epimerase/dehydratase family protein [Spirochaetes bacterium]|nr:NAD-dependent epimerase/dehydratase family protein [Spirochaetota bacterium]